MFCLNLRSFRVDFSLDENAIGQILNTSLVLKMCFVLICDHLRLNPEHLFCLKHVLITTFFDSGRRLSVKHQRVNPEHLFCLKRVLMFWFWKTFFSIAAKLLKIFEPNLVSWLFTLQGIGLMKKCTQNWLKLSLMIRVNGHITLSCTWTYSLNECKLKQNTHLKQDLCSGFSRYCTC